MNVYLKERESGLLLKTRWNHWSSLSCVHGVRRGKSLRSPSCRQFFIPKAGEFQVVTAMEEELKCPLCKQLFSNPVLLPCYHSICLNCAVQIQQTIHQQQPNHQQISNTTTTTVNNIQPHSHSHISNFHGHSHHILVTTTATVHTSSQHHQNHSNHHHHSESSSSSACSSGNGESSNDDGSDKVSILSETDSGVVVYNNSRPSSYAGTPNIHGLLFPPVQSTVFCLSCPVCHKMVYFDETGVHNLPKYRVMQNIVDRYVEARNLGSKCQLCEKNPRPATVMCEQCEIFYCDKCRESCHPSRGPLAKHVLVNPQQGKASMKLRAGPLEYKCPDHPTDLLSMYCLMCKFPVCAGCLQERKHFEHDVQPIQMMSKSQKTELSHQLQQLSEKAKSGGEFIQRLKGQTDKVNENCGSMESLVTAQIDGIVEALQQRKQELISFIRREKEYKLRSLKAEVSSHTQRLQQTTALIQFCIEALKETDPSAYLQVGSLLLARVASLESSWHSDDDSSVSSADGTSSSNTHHSNSPAPRLSNKAAVANVVTANGHVYHSPIFNSQFDLTLDDRSVLAAIRQLNFIQMKPPGPAIIIPEDCGAENNSVTVAWQPPHTSFVEGYVLEIDDGAGGPFREVYCGKETICTIDGLHFNSLYNARVKAFNSTGEGDYSDTVSLHTAEVAWFTYNSALASHGVRLSNENCTATSDSYEPRVVLGSVGFARGVHYWEYVVDKYDASADPSFGIARLDVARDEMLGKDDKGWGMYVDHQRSWFIHCGAHSCRTEGGIGPGSTIGVLLDLNKRQITFYVNEEQQGPVAFTNLYGVFYPAVSLNCNVTLTLRTAMDPPSDSDNDSGALL